MAAIVLNKTRKNEEKKKKNGWKKVESINAITLYAPRLLLLYETILFFFFCYVGRKHYFEKVLSSNDLDFDHFLKSHHRFT